MKYLLLCVIITFTAAPLFAQTGSGFRTKTTKPEDKSLLQKKPEDISKPKATGVVVQMSEHGLEVFSPLADSSLGYGENNLSKGVERDDTTSDSQDKKPFHGIKLFGWLF